MFRTVASESSQVTNCFCLPSSNNDVKAEINLEFSLEIAEDIGHNSENLGQKY